MIKKLNKLSYIQNKHKTFKPYTSKSIDDIEFLNKISCVTDENLDVTKEKRMKYLEKMNSNKSKDNLFRFDEIFAIQANKYKPEEHRGISIYDYFYNTGIMIGMVIHPKQILTLFHKVQFLIDGDSIIYVKYEHKSSRMNFGHRVYESLDSNPGDSEYYVLSDFVNRFIKNLDYEEILDCVEILEIKRGKDEEILILFHAGYLNIATEILSNIVKCELNKKCILCINFNYDTNHNDILVKFVRDNFSSYYITSTPDFGNDITPGILVYQKLKEEIKSKYILKLHTKQDPIWREELIKLFLDGNFDRLINIIKNNKQINCLGNDKLLCPAQNDKFNKILLAKTLRNINLFQTGSFFAGTVFLCRREIFENSIKRIDPILKQMVLMPFYYDNYLFWSRSPVHTAERILGFSCVEHNKYNLGINIYHKTKKCCVYASHLRNKKQFKMLKYNIEKIVKHVDQLLFIYSTDIEVNMNEISQDPKIKYYWVENLGLDFSKYCFGLNLLNKWGYRCDWYLLMNDSILFPRNMDDIFDSLNYLGNRDMVGMIDSKEIMLHYQSFFWAIKKNICGMLIREYSLYAKNDMGSIRDKNKLIKRFEVQFSNEIIKKYSTLSLFKYGSLDLDKIYGGPNPNFIPLLKEFIYNSGFPILKVKLITCEGLFPHVLMSNHYRHDANKIILFDWKIYLKYNLDLPRDWDKEDCIKHYRDYGIKESRIFSKKMLNEQKDYAFEIINYFDNPDLQKLFLSD